MLDLPDVAATKERNEVQCVTTGMGPEEDIKNVTSFHQEIGPSVVSLDSCQPYNFLDG